MPGSAAAASEKPAEDLETVAVVTRDGLAHAAPDAEAEPVMRLTRGERYLAGARRDGWARLASAPVEAWAPPSTVRLAEEPFVSEPEPDRWAKEPPPPTPGDPDTWTADRLAELEGGRVNVTGEAWTEPTSTAGTVSTISAPSGSESSWRQRARELQRTIESAEAAIERQAEAEERARERQEQAALNGYGGTVADASDAVDRARAAKASAEARLRQARAEWRDLQERARRERVPPGWLR